MSSTSVNVVPARELPDYKPPFAANSMRADADGNVWIRVNQMKPIAGHLLYDIANREGELFDRIQIPTAKSIVGFGPGGYVYLMTRGPGGSTIEKVKWRQ